ncbi:MAG: hypothetical protein ABIZ09_01890 [Rhodoferax sp.]|jgi:hypothetical protein
MRVAFLTVEAGNDLVVAFGLGDHAQTRLTLLRTPKFEHLLDEHERGVWVSTGEAADDTFLTQRELLVSVKWANEQVEIESNERSSILDVSAVDASVSKACFPSKI